jgi:proliferating cell nuclear antigen
MSFTSIGATSLIPTAEKKRDFFFGSPQFDPEDDFFFQRLVLGSQKKKMNLRFWDGGMLRRLVDGVKDLVPEVLMTVTAEDGIKWQEMDSSHVSLVAVNLRPPSFSELVITAGPGHTVPLGVNMSALSKILRCGGKTDDVCWKLDETSVDTLEITTDRPKKNNLNARGRLGKFSLKLMTIDREAFAVPDTEYGAHVFLRASALQRVVKDLMSFGTDVVITVTKDHINFAIDGDHGTGELTLSNIRHSKITVASFDCYRHAQLSTSDNPKDEMIDDDADCAYIFTQNDDTSIQLKFAMRFLASFAACSSLSPHLQISIEKDTPIRLQYPLYRTTTTGTSGEEQKSSGSGVSKDESSVVDEDHKKSGTKRKRKEGGSGSGSGSGSGEQKTSVATTATKVMKKSNEPGCDDIVGMVAFYLAPKIEDAPLVKETTTDKKNNDLVADAEE